MPTNPFYQHSSGVPVALSRGASSVIRAEYDALQTAFDLVNTALGLKGAIAGQAWTGAHDFTGGSIAVPTAAAGDSSTKAASTAFVATSFAPTAAPTFTGAVVLPSTTSIGTVSAAEIAFVDGVTSPIQTQLDSKAPIASPTFTGTVTIPGGASIAGYAPTASPALTGTPTAPTAAVGTNTTQIATMAALIAQAFSTALPAQPGGTITYQLTSVGGAASWAVNSSAASSLYLANNYGAF